MKYATLMRLGSSDHGTFGVLECEDFSCRTLELPWRENMRELSCVPAGIYFFKWRDDSPKHGGCYEEWDDPDTPEREDVIDRDYIQIHAANLAGDVNKGYVSQLEGCIAPGEKIVTFKGGAKPAGRKDQKGISSSRTALHRLEQFFGKETFVLDIRWAPIEEITDETS